MYEIQINRNRNSTNSSTDKAILRELKEIRKSLNKKDNGSGGTSSFGAIGGLLRGGVKTATAAAASAFLLGGAVNLNQEYGGPSDGTVNPYSRVTDAFGNTVGGEFNGGVSYEKAVIEGKDVVLKTNAKTGEILEILTRQEAEQQGILLVSGQLKNKYKELNSAFDEIAKNYESSQGSVVLTNSDLDDIQKSTSEAASLNKTYVELLKERNRLIQQDIANSGGSLVRGGGGTTPIAAGNVGTVIDTGIQVISELIYREQQPAAFLRLDKNLLNVAKYFIKS